jgi:oligoribonuclease
MMSQIFTIALVISVAVKAIVNIQEGERLESESNMALKFRSSTTILAMTTQNILPPNPQLEKSDQNLIWLDCEMTGLDPELDRIIEIAVIVTGPKLECRTEGPVLVIHQVNEQLDRMDAWNKGTHGRSGLIDKVKGSTLTEDEAQRRVLLFLAQYVPKKSSPMCGNSVGQDRRFLTKYMPKLESYFHYRNLDVSTLKELSKRWCPEVYESFKKKQLHTALADVHESIDELEHYRKYFLKSVD